MPVTSTMTVLLVTLLLNDHRGAGSSVGALPQTGKAGGGHRFHWPEASGNRQGNATSPLPGLAAHDADPSLAVPVRPA
ncbi:hypothetical protein SAT01_32300 [Sinomonas atrocyanea]|nr:hypothetical protein SAT01_32300 [Sinomonas atrocyanea]GGG60878.1 hypothetical protein GCM10007172_09860 [Sinomonas atrocyanea]